MGGGEVAGGGVVGKGATSMATGMGVEAEDDLASGEDGAMRDFPGGVEGGEMGITAEGGVA